MARIPPNMGIKEKEMYKQLIRDQVERIQSIGIAARMTKSIQGQIAREKEDKAKRRAYDITQLAARNPYGWAADSQSAKDWAEASYKSAL